MKRLLLVVLALGVFLGPDRAPAQSSGFVEAGRRFEWNHVFSPRSLIYLHSNDAQSFQRFPRDIWHEVDVTQFGVPANAISVTGQGLFMANNGAPRNQHVGFYFAIRKPGTTNIQCRHSIGRVLTYLSGDGVRQGERYDFPVANGKISFCWSLDSPMVEPNPTANNRAFIGISLFLISYTLPP